LAHQPLHFQPRPLGRPGSAVHTYCVTPRRSPRQTVLVDVNLSACRRDLQSETLELFIPTETVALSFLGGFDYGFRELVGQGTALFADCWSTLTIIQQSSWSKHWKPQGIHRKLYALIFCYFSMDQKSRETPGN
jgi:hypothetical protein